MKMKHEDRTERLNSDFEPRQILSATENPEEAKRMMIIAMCSNEVLGLSIAAMQRMTDPTKWADGTQLYDLNFMTHAKWLETDSEYAQTILLIEKEGFKAQKMGHWAMGMGMAAEDAQVWKAMLAEINRLEAAQKQPENVQENPFEGLSDATIMLIYEEKAKAKAIKIA